MRVGVEPTSEGLQSSAYSGRPPHRKSPHPDSNRTSGLRRHRRGSFPWSSSLGWSRTTATGIRSPGTDVPPARECPWHGSNPLSPRWQRGVLPLGPHGQLKKGWRDSNPLLLLGRQGCKPVTPHPHTRRPGIEPSEARFGAPPAPSARRSLRMARPGLEPGSARFKASRSAN